MLQMVPFHLRKIIMILNNLFPKYIAHIEVLHSKQTVKTNIAYYNKHIKDTLGKKHLKSISYLDIQLFTNNLLKQDYKVKTVKNILSIIKVLFKFAIKLQLIEKNPSLDIELPKFDNTRYFNFPLSVQQDFIKAIKDFNEPIYKDIFFFLLHGRRKSEVLNLTWDMIDLDQRLYYIPAKINKAKRNMCYKMTDELYQRLYKHFLLSCIQQNTKFPSGYVFINLNTNRPYRDLRKPFQRLINTYNLPKIRLHDLRHLIGSYSINYLNLPIEHISYTLGHTSIDITQKYITVKPQISKDVIDKILCSLD